MHLTASFALALSAAFGVNQTAAVALPPPMPQVQTVEDYVRKYYADEPVLADIAQCESQMRQFDRDGNVLRNPTSSAIGLMQIMSSIHYKTADELGLDIYTIQGNLAYARYLYEKEGTVPWNYAC
jgi:hypothetical protein